MDDPWDVKSVRKSGQYTSCMKINGVPLLPPVLSRECRSEMQYYRLLAKEVEKRISILQPYVENDMDSNEDKTDAPDITDCDYDANEARQDTQDISQNINKITDVEIHNDTISNNNLHSELYNFGSNDTAAETTITPPHLILDFSLNMNDTCNVNENTSSPPQVMDIPERDYNCVKSVDLLTDVEIKNITCKQQQDTIIEEIVNFSFSIAREKSTESYLQETMSQDGPPSLSSKSFTGSLNNIHMQSESNDLIRPLVRQHSYTILNPSPQLLAHLEVQSLNLGVDMSCISMSESLTNLSSHGKKRRSWDLESAKAKWSNMAMELKQKNLTKPNLRRVLTRGPPLRTVSPSRAKCVAAARTKYSSLSLKQTIKAELAPKTRTHSPPRTITSSPSRTRPSSPGRIRTSSPVRDAPSSSTIILEPSLRKETKSNISMEEPTSPKNLNSKKGPHESPNSAKEASKTNQKTQPLKISTPQPQKKTEPISSSKGNTLNKNVIPKHVSISESVDPAARVRELYEKIQQQQKKQMVSLMEKQKREQILLQQAFEEQNNLLFKQLKTICPKAPEKVKEAWGDKNKEADRGPVSLSQLINSKSPDPTSSPVSSTLTDSNNYISHCDVVLKKSRDITDSIKSIGKSQSVNGAKVAANVHLEGSRTRTNSPTSPIVKTTPTSRRLNYDTSGSERDYDLMLTDRTNDTLADLNVTFPSDSEESRLSHKKGPEVTVIHKTTPIRSTDSAIKCMEQTIQRSINSCSARVRNIVNCQPTARQLTAATKIVAHAKGYLVRRLMQTARVQSTVQTIKDALLCALQLHQDREGIRGADVDLHRRLIQQITAACYSLHDTFITSTANERCAMIAADRSRRASLAARPPPKHRNWDAMSQSHSGAFPPRQKRFSAPSASLMTQSNYETYSSEKGRARYMPSPRRSPWR